MIYYEYKTQHILEGFYNSLMSFQVDKLVISLMEYKLQCVPIQHIKYLIKQLTIEPVNFQRNIHQILYQSMISYCKEKMVDEVCLDFLFQEIVKRATKTHNFFGNRLQKIFQNQSFFQSLKNMIQPDQYPIVILNQLFNVPEPKTQKENQKGDKLCESKLLQVCNNLLSKPQCLCENKKQIKIKNDTSFKCSHCNRLFHTVCMAKKPQSQFCCYCHLQRMAPLKKVVKTVFVGLLKKSKRKHAADFLIPQIQGNQRLQFRCLRLKNDSQFACLFPDVAEISINGQKCQSFEPINKHSCLKYRKDEPFNLLQVNYYKQQENRLHISQLITVNRKRDYRLEYQDHLIGLYVVEDLKIDELINQTKNTNLLGFRQSHSVLQNSFDLGKDEQIACQLVKIPLWCPLTRIKIQIPARGYYCTHYQCFDLKNYLKLISESQNPRWKCPLCNSMAFQFKIDSILMEIIKEASSDQNINEILFFKNGDYCQIVDNEPISDKKNIRNLKIPLKSKKTKHIPENAEVILLDQDQ